jgi:hypothetical protein
MVVYPLVVGQRMAGRSAEAGSSRRRYTSRYADHASQKHLKTLPLR